MSSFVFEDILIKSARIVSLVTKINMTMTHHQHLKFYPAIHVLLMVVNPLLSRCQNLLVALSGICLGIIVQILSKGIVQTITTLLTILCFPVNLDVWASFDSHESNKKPLHRSRGLGVCQVTRMMKARAKYGGRFALVPEEPVVSAVPV